MHQKPKTSEVQPPPISTFDTEGISLPEESRVLQTIDSIRAALPPFASFSVTKIRSMSGKGCVLDAVVDGTEVVIKANTFADAYWSQRFVREQRAYEEFSASPPPFLIPQVIFSSEQKGVLVLQKLKGMVLNAGRYPDDPIKEVELSKTLELAEDVHNYNLRHPSSRALVEANYYERFCRYAKLGVLNESDINLLNQFRQQYEWTPWFAHGDMLFCNILRVDHCLALIDWEFADYYYPYFDHALLNVTLINHPCQAKLIKETHSDTATRDELIAFDINRLAIFAREIRTHSELPPEHELRSRLPRLHAGLSDARESLRSALIK